MPRHLTRPHLTPADVEVILAHLAAAAAALPQAARRLSDILDETRHNHALVLDTMTDIEDPDLAIDTARVHLDATRDPAVSLHPHLDAARNDPAHGSVVDRRLDDMQRREQDRRSRTARIDPSRVVFRPRGSGYPR